MVIGPDNYPFLSIIIPTKNEEEFIGKLLESIYTQTYLHDRFEILLFDGISTDSTLKVVEDYMEKLDLRIFQNQKIRQVYAWNEGIKKARGDYFILVGAHSYLDNFFLETSVKTYQKVKSEESKLAAVGGSLNIVFKNRFAKMIKILYSSPYAGVSSFWSKEEQGFKETVVFGLYDKKIVMDVGMFDEDFIIGDDYELNLRLNKNGYRLFSNPDIKSYYFSRSSLKSFLKQSFEYGAVKGLCIRTGYNRLIWWIPLLFLIFELSTIASVFTNLFTAMLFLLGLYFMGSAIFSIYTYIKSKEILSISLIIFHFIYHNIVALGLLRGVIRGRKTFR
ncbi:MAG: glycosyltransferase [Methanobacterium sp.]|nr:glycosyltransferase [Methanobacterium sp.]